MIYLSFAVAVFLLASAENSYACSCFSSSEPREKQIEEAYLKAGAVFSGRVISIRQSRTNKSYFTVRFKVAKSWKGASRGVIAIDTEKDSAMCGFYFKNGKKYLVYAHGKSGDFSTNNCSRTMMLTADGDAQYLNELTRKNKKTD